MEVTRTPIGVHLEFRMRANADGVSPVRISQTWI